MVAEEAQRVDAWRLQTLLDAGYEQFRAELLAMREDVDLHLAVWLLERGCPQDVALNILL